MNRTPVEYWDSIDTELPEPGATPEPDMGVHLEGEYPVPEDDQALGDAEELEGDED